MRNNIFDPSVSMKTTLPAAYFKNRFDRVLNCAITQDICTRLLGLLHAFVYQSYNNRAYLVSPRVMQTMARPSCTRPDIFPNPAKTYTITYLLLAECKVRTASYRPSFFLPFMAQARSARAMKTRKEKTRIHNLLYGPSKRG